MFSDKKIKVNVILSCRYRHKDSTKIGFTFF
uniref:Uncharacterized protein n=1 Tax=Arundo donax TaxID=35708 RepID=A0A0A8Z6Q1_ARUDO